MKFTEQDKEILHSYVDNSEIEEIIDYIEYKFGSREIRHIKNENENNSNFDVDELIDKIQKIIKQNNECDESDSEQELVNFGELQYELEIVYVSMHYLRGVEEMIYSPEKVQMVLEKIPNIIYEEFEKSEYSRITDYIISNNDMKNLSLVGKILEKDNKNIIDVIESDFNAMRGTKKMIKYIVINLKKNPTYNMDNLIEKIKENDDLYFSDEETMNAHEFIEYIKKIE